MKLISYGVLLSLVFSSCIFVTQPKLETITQRNEEKIEKPININYKIEPINNNSFNFAVSRNIAIREVISTWETIFDNLKVSKNDKRRKNFYKYAESLVDCLRFFQSGIADSELTQNIVKSERYRNISYRDTNVILPNNRYTHILIAYVIYKETSVDHTVVGKKPRFEVGLMQLWAAALQKYPRLEVKNDYSLGLFLGIRWLGLALQDCSLDPTDFRMWDWMRVLAYYGAGPKAKQNGICSNKYRFARHRVLKSIELAKEISTM